jgi:DNA/RNA endonuclease YhcR with UshA esterase domain
MKKLVLIVTLLWVGEALAHHSTATNFTQEIIEINGVVEQIRFQNPHTSILVKVEAGAGEAPFWLVESDARSTYVRRGVDLDVIAKGSKVTVTGRKGVRPNTMFLREVLFEDGTRFTSNGTGRD